MKDRDIRVVIMDRSPVELYKVLKFENLAASGGEAKHFIADGMVRVNKQKETRKRKKIYSGDLIEFEGVQLKMELPE